MDSNPEAMGQDLSDEENSGGDGLLSSSKGGKVPMVIMEDGKHIYGLL